VAAAGVLATGFLATFFVVFLVVLAVEATGGLVVAGAGVEDAGACAKVRVMEASAKAIVETVVFILFSPAGLAARSQSHTAAWAFKHR
jgi:hypothetical protein